MKSNFSSKWNMWGNELLTTLFPDYIRVCTHKHNKNKAQKLLTQFSNKLSLIIPAFHGILHKGEQHPQKKMVSTFYHFVYQHFYILPKSNAITIINTSV